MLTAKENMREVIRGGNPDRLPNSYEALRLLVHPLLMFGSGMPAKGGPDVVNDWGVTYSFPANVPGPFPVHTPDKIVIKDIENWRDYVKAPSLDFTEEQWAAAKAMFDAVDGTKTYKAAMVAPGLFEQCHHLLSIPEALMAYYEYPDEMHELIEFLMNWELELAKGICDHLHPDAIFHHDDWGTEISSFLSPSMFREFFLEPYKKIYKYYHDHGVEIIVHHSDSYAANLVPTMIEMGIDVWQGAISTNNIPELLKKYGGQITIMGGIDNKFVDFEGRTYETCNEVARRVIEECGDRYFIPCLTQGDPGCAYKGTYEYLVDVIDHVNCEKYGHKLEDIQNAREPIQLF